MQEQMWVFVHRRIQFTFSFFCFFLLYQWALLTDCLCSHTAVCMSEFMSCCLHSSLCPSTCLCICVFIYPDCTARLSLSVDPCVCRRMIKGICQGMHRASVFLLVFSPFICMRVMLLRKGLTVEVLKPHLLENQTIDEANEGAERQKWQREAGERGEVRGNKVELHVLDPCNMEIWKLPPCIFT